jgi:hypothetical protein
MSSGLTKAGSFLAAGQITWKDSVHEKPLPENKMPTRETCMSCLDAIRQFFMQRLKTTLLLSVSKRHWLNSACLLSLILVPVGAFSALAADIPLPFDDADSGINSDWREQSFRATDPTRYRLTEEGDAVVLEAESHKQASGLIYEIDVDLASYPILVWRWKVDGIIPAGNALTKEGDDYPARVYVVFPHWFKPKTRSINYIWANRLVQGEVVPNPFFGNARMVAVQSGNTQAGTWVAECRNVYQDYQKIFGEAPPQVGAIALMTDTDNTGGKARAWYADIRLVAAERDADPSAYCP